ncbi:hypothetical protein B0H14DRAFT_2929399, partial [Mycena olivaceomarginata]
GKSGTPRDGSTHHHRCIAQLGHNTPACQCSLRAVRLSVHHCQEKWDRGPGAGTVCGKALSMSTLVEAPATPPALSTRVRAGEREKDADAGLLNSALSPLPYPYCGAGGTPTSLCTPAPSPNPTESTSTSGVRESLPLAWPYEVVCSARENCESKLYGGETGKEP